MKTALITGATDGIGKATAVKLLSEGWKVVIIGRNPARCEGTVMELKTVTRNNDDLRGQAQEHRHVLR